MENMRRHRDIKLVTTEEKRIKLVSEPNYYTTEHFSMLNQNIKTKQNFVTRILIALLLIFLLKIF